MTRDDVKSIQPPSDVLPPGLAAQFEIVRLLGRGGMGEVYLARERVLDRLVAIKVLTSQGLIDDDLAPMSEMIASAAPLARRRPGGPPRWSAADKAAYLAAFATSRLTIRAFCHERGVPRATFTLWQREARAAQAMPAPHQRATRPPLPPWSSCPLPSRPGSRWWCADRRGSRANSPGSMRRPP